MTYRVLILAYRKPGTTPTQFKQHYENTHIPLVKSIAGLSFPLTHARHYLQCTESPTSDPEAASNPATVLVGTQEDFAYDSYAELTWEDVETFQKFFAAVSEPEVAKRIAEDEERFLDRGKMRIVRLGECTVTKRA